jgi:hypothetical protein
MGRGSAGPIASLRSVGLGLVLAAVLGLVCSSQALALGARVYSSFGSEGPAAGQLDAPTSVAVDLSSGDVYVADSQNFRVEKFDASGNFILMFGKDVNETRVKEAGSTEAQRDLCTAESGDTCQAGVQGSEGAGQFDVPQFVAIDNSPGGEGDVYVADTGTSVVSKFDSSGRFLASNTGLTATNGPFGALAGIAVDQSGNLWVYDQTAEMFEFDQSGGFIQDWNAGFQPVPDGIAVDSHDNLYIIYVANNWVLKLSSTGQLFGLVSRASMTGIALDPSNNEIYSDETGTAIDRFASSCEPTIIEGNLNVCSVAAHFGSGDLNGATDLTLDPVDQKLYVADTGDERIDVFTSVIVPDVTVASASDLTPTAATLHGTVNPDGLAVTSCHFQYGATTSYGHTAPCVESEAQIGSGTEPVQVHAEISGLQAHTAYHFRLDAGNENGVNDGQEETQDETLTTSGSPIVDGESFSSVGAATATLSAQVNGVGLPTTYRFEYGTSEAYGSETSETTLGAASGDVGASAQLGEPLPLTQDTAYHFRVIATNRWGSTPGADETFSTLPATISGLPDGRVYEMVTPADKQDADAYERKTGAGQFNIETELPFEASPAGDALAYLADPTPQSRSGSFGPGQGAQYLARRSPVGGWEQQSIAPGGIQASVYQGFSSDLSVGIFDSCLVPNTATLTATYDVLYAHPFGTQAYEPLSSRATPPLRSEQAFGSWGVGMPGQCIRNGRGPVAYAGSSSDSSHILFEANEALTPEALDGGETSDNLYDSVGGRLRLVNVLPSGKGTPAPGASFGGPKDGEYYGEEPDFSHVVSADGSRVFWTDLGTNDLYVRENDASSDATTVLLAENARYWTASADGSKVFYTTNVGGELYEYDLEGAHANDLTPGVGVSGVLGASEDGEYLYFVGAAGLAGENTQGRQPTAGKPNLYLDHGGVITFIATLSDSDDSAYYYGSNYAIFGAWQPGLGDRTAEVSPDGRGVVFMSYGAPTGYYSAGLSEVFVYDADSGRLYCASCSSSGEPPTSGARDPERAGELLVSHNPTYQPRMISAGGGRVFFDTPEPLVPQDINGVRDVYEWERAGTGTCERAAGCVYLLSGGTSAEPSSLLDASSNGDDVFFVTHAQLVPQDRNENSDVYDASADGPPLISPATCSGSGCQGVPPAPPIFATPSSVTFAGVGNFSPPSRTGAPQKTTGNRSSRRRCARGKKLIHGKCVKAKTKSKKKAKAKNSYSGRRVSR